MGKGGGGGGLIYINVICADVITAKMQNCQKLHSVGVTTVSGNKPRHAIVRANSSPV